MSQSAYRKQARKYHPELNPGDQSAEEKFKELNEAYEPKLNETKAKFVLLGAREERLYV